MGMDTVGAAASFLSDWNDAMAKAKDQVQGRAKTSRERAMESFADAMIECDKAVESIVDKHQENVARSAQKLREYHKKLAVEEQRRRAAEDQREFLAEAQVRAINRRNQALEDMMFARERRESFDARG